MSAQKKKVLFVAYSFPPISTSGIFRVTHFVNLLAQRGKYLPYVLTVKNEFYEKTAPRDHSLLAKVDRNVVVNRTKCIHLREFLVRRFRKGLRAKNVAIREKIDGINKKVIVRKSVWQKIKDVVTDEIVSFPDIHVGWLPYAVKAGLNIIRQEKIDIIFATGAPWTALWAGKIMHDLSGVPLVLDYRDPWIDNPFKNYSKTILFDKLSALLEKVIVKSSSIVILNTESLRESFIMRYGKEEKFCTLHNGYLEQELYPYSEIDEQDKDKEDNEFRFIHAGSLYGNRSVENFLISFKDIVNLDIICEKKVKLYLIGVEAKVAHKCISILGKQIFENHCVLHGRIPHKECVDYLIASHCFLIFQQDTTIQVPRKLFEYLALRKPILAVTPQDGETAKIINQNGAGLVVQDHSKDITDAIKNMLNNYKDYSARLQSNNGYKKYEMGALTVKLENIFDDILKI